MVHRQLTFLKAGDIRHHDLRISHPCPTTPRSCPDPLISYKTYQIELTTLTMTKANPMYLIVGGSHPHAFLHDRRMLGRDIKNEWGDMSWNTVTPTQVQTLSYLFNFSASVDSLQMENPRRHGEACISQLASSLKQGPMNL
jgi:hypothetical protein